MNEQTTENESETRAEPGAEPSVERETTLETSPERAWEAISDPEQLQRWLAEEVELEPVEGSPARFVVDGTERDGVIREVDPGRRITFTWRAPEQPATLVELTLTPLQESGPVRLTIVETAPAGVPVASLGAGFPSWSTRLHRLAGIVSRRRGTLVLAS